MPKPQVVIWFKVYCALMVLMFVAVAAVAGWVAANPDVITVPDAPVTSSAPTSEGEAVFMAVIYGGFSAIFAILFLVPLFLPRRFWVWVFDLVLVALGLTSCLTWPITIPLLIFWIREDTRRWFKNEPPAALDADTLRPF